jgi:hypothetical protein
MVEGRIKMRQGPARSRDRDVRQSRLATRKSAAEASDLAQLVQLQAEWTRVNVQKCAAYWRDLYEVATRDPGRAREPRGLFSLRPPPSRATRTRRSSA